MTTTAAALQGTLEDLAIPELLRLLCNSRQTGVLHLDGGTGGRVVLDNGRITVATSETGPSLRQVLVGSGVTTDEGFTAASANFERGESSLAEGLVRFGGADLARMRHVLYEHTISSVFEMMLPSRDSFHFQPGESHPAGERFRFSVEQVIADAERRLEAWTEIAESIPSVTIVMQMRPLLPPELPTVTISPEEWSVLAALDGRRSIADLVLHLGMSAFAVCDLLHRLLMRGIVEVLGRDR
ncbi:MAG: hypothetical protein JJLCMIEE_01305 [Acidimicrobiales bacterium]|nr:MAG: DUF4388 domain-containing protein [Actinomycetota bacterium]MBV6508245.1 hypothetical protein [Acidimicrobiales bacterium]RIK07316.1 MAG: hypothetical protein DCC48_04360 [Acidobacteriota bacterium]